MKAEKEIIELISEMVIATTDNLIDWKQQNPTTLIFWGPSESGNEAIISIQYIANVYPKKYILTVANSTTSEKMISLDSSTVHNYSIESAMKELYDVATESIERRSLDFLQGVIKNLKDIPSGTD